MGHRCTDIGRVQNKFPGRQHVAMSEGAICPICDGSSEFFLPQWLPASSSVAQPAYKVAHQAGHSENFRLSPVLVGPGRLAIRTMEGN